MSTHSFAATAHTLSATLLAAAVAAGCQSRAGLQLSDPTTLTTATDVGTAPMFAVSPTGAHAAAWVSAPNGGTDGRLYISINGAPPTEIRDSLGPIQAHGESPPELSYATDGTLYATYTVGRVEPGARFPLSALRLVKSADGGATWTAPMTVTDGPVFGSHMFEALHVAHDGTVYVSWLGKPEGDTSSDDMPMAAMSSGSMAMGTSQDGHAMHMASTVWITRSTDGGRTWLPRVRVDLGDACPCCRTSLATAADGTLYIAWRHVYPGNVRDIVVARSTDHGATWGQPVKVHEDDWHFDACPHAGPSIALDSAGTLHVAWWTGKEGSAGVFYARSTDGARTFSAPVAIGAAQYSQPSHVQLALGAPHRVIVAWDDGTKQVPQVMVRVSSDAGLRFGPAVPVSVAGRSGTFPVLGVSGDSIAIAWSDRSAASGRATARATAAAHASHAGSAGGSTMAQGLEPVGDAQVLVRRGVLE